MCFKQKKNMNERMKMREKTKRFEKAGMPSGRAKVAGQVVRRQIWKSLVHFAKESNFIPPARESHEKMLSRVVR